MLLLTVKAQGRLVPEECVGQAFGVSDDIALRHNDLALDEAFLGASFEDVGPSGVVVPHADEHDAVNGRGRICGAVPATAEAMPATPSTNRDRLTIPPPPPAPSTHGAM